jgi:iron-sulfur cluster repair protein YtfE (RIC family)
MISNAQRRTVLLIQHDRLRARIAALRSAAAAVITHGADVPQTATDELMQSIAAFGGELTTHLETEEDMLIPVLEQSHPWGAVRIQLLHAEHAHQRGVLHVLRAATLRPAELARRAWALTTDVLADMEAEEKDLFSEAVLGQDPPEQAPAPDEFR